MKKLFSLGTILLLFLLLLTGCNKVSSEVVGKYNLISISGLPGVTANTYDYNYVELKSNGDYYLENKVNGTITTQSGTFEYDEETKIITLITKSGSMSVKEEAQYDPDTQTFTLESQISSYATVTMIFEKEVVVEGSTE